MKDVKIEILIATAQGRKNVKGLTGDLKDLGATTSRSGKKVSGSFDGIGKSVAGSVAKFGLYTAAAGTVVAAGRRMIIQGKEYQNALADLEAITGITGDSLERLSDNALDLSVKYGESASNIIEANKLVASQLAEKIDFGTDEGMRQLQEVSEQAVVLQKAAGVDLATAVKTLTTAVNQFNLDASETPRIINSIAAGSKYGAAEVAQQAEAYKEAGSVAASVNLQFEDLNASVQVLAANAISGSRAGVQIRNVLLTLNNSAKLAEAGIEGVNLQSEGLSESLAKLNPLLENSAALEKLFGRESITAAQILIKNANAVEEMTRKVTDSNVAQEQLNVQMDTFETAQARLTAAMDAQLIPAFQETGGVMVTALNTLTDWVVQTGYAISVINDFFDAHSELRDQIEQNATELDLYRSAMRGVRNELAQASMEGEVSAEKQEELRKSYNQTTESIQSRAKTLEEDTALLKEQRQAVQDQIDKFEEANAIEDIFLSKKLGKGLLDLQKEFEALDLSISANQVQLEEYYAVIKEGGASFEDFVAMMKKANEKSDEPAEAAKNLGEQYADNKDKIEALLNQAKPLTSEQYEQLRTLTAQNKAIEQQIELRKQAADPSSIEDFELSDQEMNIDASIEEMNNDSFQEMEDQRRKAHQEWMDQYDEKKAKAIEVGEAEQSVWAGTAEAIGQAAAQQIMYADTGKEAIGGMIKALIAEIVARAILGAFNPPTPASIALAPILAAGAVRLTSSLIPGFRTGVDDFEGGLARVHKGEVITHLPKGANVITNKNVQALERMSRQQSFIPNVGSSSRVVVQPADNRELLAAIQDQTTRLESVERRVEISMSEIKRREKLWNQKEAELG
mgnify:CR=1 FL=1|tara:strand:- start:144711 stop:147269 length:2559 start_codon:yes stop_codon:yes gene_type:complete